MPTRDPVIPPDERSALRRLRWLGVLVPLGFLVLVEIARRLILQPQTASWLADAALFIAIGVGAIVFSWTMFGAIAKLQARLAQRNRELIALDRAGLAVTSDLDLPTVLQRVVDQARELLGARYGALSTRPDEGRMTFLTSGISPEQRVRMGPPPVGHGLLGVTLSEGEHLRLEDLTQDPRSVGFPANHPPMRSLLAVPIRAGAEVTGNLYLSEKRDGSPFTSDDESTLVRFATHAALAISNARLHREVRALATTEERERIAREIHDGAAQVLGYVSTKAQAVELLIESGQPAKAAEQTRQLGAAARQAYAEVREDIAGLRATRELANGLIAAITAHLSAWRELAGIPVELTGNAASGRLTGLSSTTEVQLFRIVQEALVNVRRHARAQSAEVRIEREGSTVTITVVDDGQGFDADAAPADERTRYGLATMRERADGIGGRLTIASRPGAGTRVTIRVPAVPNDEGG